MISENNSSAAQKKFIDFWFQLTLFLTIALSCFATLPGYETELDIYLNTGISLPKVWLVSKASGFSWSLDYSRALASTLRFDLDQSGYFEILKSLEKDDRLLINQGLIGFSKAAPHLRAQGAKSAIYLHFEKSFVDVHFVKTDQKHCKTLHRIPLTGNLQEDRGQMHNVSRQIHRQWLGKDGIAHCRVLFARKTSGEVSEIWECDYDGHNARVLTDEKSLALTPTPLSLLDAVNRGILYVSYKIGQPRIQFLSPGQQRGVRVCPLFGNQFMPNYHVKTDRLAFVCDHLGHPEIYLQNLRRGKATPQPLFRSPQGVQASPSFSPKGNQIAFVSNKDGSPRIYIANLQQIPIWEKRVELVSRKNRENTSPSWSPDGTKIAFCAKEAGTRQIWIFDLLSKREFPLTKTPGHKENPSWAPDSLHLVFNTAQDGNAELFLIDLVRAQPLKITSGSGEKRFASWTAYR